MGIPSSELSEHVKRAIAKQDSPKGLPPLRWAMALPYPPSINDYYGTKPDGTKYIKPKGALFRAEVIALAGPSAPHHPKTTRLSMSVLVNCPDHRERDLDNILKALQDALQHAGVYVKDSQIDALLIRRGEVMRGGQVHVTMEVLE